MYIIGVRSLVISSSHLVKLSFNGLWSYPCSRSTRTGYNSHSELSYLGYLGGAVTFQPSRQAIAWSCYIIAESCFLLVIFLHSLVMFLDMILPLWRITQEITSKKAKVSGRHNQTIGNLNLIFPH